MTLRQVGDKLIGIHQRFKPLPYVHPHPSRPGKTAPLKLSANSVDVPSERVYVVGKAERA